MPRQNLNGIDAQVWAEHVMTINMLRLPTMEVYLRTPFVVTLSATVASRREVPILLPIGVPSINISGEEQERRYFDLFRQPSVLQLSGFFGSEF